MDAPLAVKVVVCPEQMEVDVAVAPTVGVGVTLTVKFMLALVQPLVLPVTV